VAAIDARKLGYVVRDLGAGRMQKEDEVDPTAGIVLNKKPGDAVQPGDLLAQIYTQKSARLPVFQTAVRDAFHFTVDPPAPRPLLLDRYTKQGWQYNT
jgi:pyrimidine-nucleoside phosphorylase